MTNEENLFKEYMKNPVTKKAFLGALETITDVLSMIKPVEESEDCVSRSELKKKLMSVIPEQVQVEGLLSYLCYIVDSLPSVTPAEKVGRWIEHFDVIGKWYECDQCHTDLGGLVNYCPNCGAKMEGE